MLFVNQLHNVTITVVLSLFGIIISSFPTLANEKPITNPKPLDVPSGNIRDLEGLQEKTASQWLGVGGEYDAFVDTQTAYEPQMNAFVMKTSTINDFWRDASTTFATNDIEADPNLGDPKRSGFRIPFAQF